jgi:hypothetical protein
LGALFRHGRVVFVPSFHHSRVGFSAVLLHARDGVLPLVLRGRPSCPYYAGGSLRVSSASFLEYLKVFALTLANFLEQLAKAIRREPNELIGYWPNSVEVNAHSLANIHDLSAPYREGNVAQHTCNRPDAPYPACEMLRKNSRCAVSSDSLA